jgi:hypothetical protein
MGRRPPWLDYRSANDGLCADSTGSRIFKFTVIRIDHDGFKSPVKLLRRALNEMRSFKTIFAKMTEQLRIVGSPVHVTIRRTLNDPLARIYMI